MSRVEGKVAFVTGAARGMGRSHAMRLAEEGADIIAVDICADIDAAPYAMATADDLAQTVKGVEALGQRIVARQADVRDPAGLAKAVADGVAELGRLDIVVANAGFGTVQTWDAVTPEVWQTIMDVNLTGCWNTVTAALPHVIEGGRGGSLILISSSSGIKGHPFLTPYVASKFAIVGIAKSLANELGRHLIRVNSVHPAGVDTPLLRGLGDIDALIALDPEVGSMFVNTLPVALVDAQDVSNAVLYLASDESRYVTGTQFKVDAGTTNR